MQISQAFVLVMGKGTIARSLKNTVFNTIPNIVRKTTILFILQFFYLLFKVLYQFYFIYNSNFKKAVLRSYTISFRIKTLVSNLNISIIYTVELEHNSNRNRIAITMSSVKQEMLMNVKKNRFLKFSGSVLISQRKSSFPELLTFPVACKCVEKDSNVLRENGCV